MYLSLKLIIKPFCQNYIWFPCGDSSETWTFFKVANNTATLTVENHTKAFAVNRVFCSQALCTRLCNSSLSPMLQRKTWGRYLVHKSASALKMNKVFKKNLEAKIFVKHKLIKKEIDNKYMKQISEALRLLAMQKNSCVKLKMKLLSIILTNWEHPKIEIYGCKYGIQTRETVCCCFWSVSVENIVEKVLGTTFFSLRTFSVRSDFVLRPFSLRSTFLWDLSHRKRPQDMVTSHRRKQKQQQTVSRHTMEFKLTFSAHDFICFDFIFSSLRRRVPRHHKTFRIFGESNSSTVKIPYTKEQAIHKS